ncbi:Na+/H+ antiporter subunit E [Desulfurivibrio alkaliphilus]|uniref:Cation antiporter n=1 Tax=Desulfurivibrio alkaliphilus (strain DSM 19089 / UNIQEM U267 / AHT2) TaxID=589865 RepID=D6Z740_DESAT|nr:Na+/H+ antiporter subunit E [Desulfurivibrio alkaliphilus]ADH87027.1 cation antiporter [Desulfurivibrio alkaliphilus AHT 2]
MILFADHRHFARRLLRRSLELAIIWLVLTGAAPDGLLPGLIVVISAAVASLLLPPGYSWVWRPLGLLRFLPFFMIRSLLAGFDVARRAFSPDPRLAPTLVTFRWRLAEGPARVFFANAVSLLPGTLSVGFDRESLEIHSLDRSPGLEQELRRLETRIDELFKQETESATREGAHER